MRNTVALKSGIAGAKSDEVQPNLRLLNCGIDSLYGFAHGKLDETFMSRLRELRAGDPGHEVVADFPSDGSAFVLTPFGWRGYPFRLAATGYEIRLGAAEPFPSVFVEVRSWFLHERGPEAAVIEINRRLAEDVFASGGEILPSRIDVNADIQGWDPVQRDLERFTCRARWRDLYQPEAELHEYGSELSGFVFGKGDLSARVYDKRREQLMQGDTGASLFWSGADPDSAVWRIEFQFRRPALVELGLAEMSAALATRQALWTYGTEWLSLRSRSAHTKRSRWPEDPMWAWLRTVEVGLPCSPLVRQRLRRANLERVVRGLTGNLSSLGALSRTGDLAMTLRVAGSFVERYMDERGETFRARVNAKAARNRAFFGEVDDE